MPIISRAFDDDEEDPLTVFSGADLLAAHYDWWDLDWEEVAERALLDERRGLVVTQSVAIEDLLVEVTMYVEDPADPMEWGRRVGGWTLGRKINAFQVALERRELLDSGAEALLGQLGQVATDRNLVAHGVLVRRPAQVVPVAELGLTDLVLEWVILDRRTGEKREVSMRWLRSLVRQSQSAFLDLLSYFQRLAERVPAPENLGRGTFLSGPHDL